MMEGLSASDIKIPGYHGDVDDITGNYMRAALRFGLITNTNAPFPRL